MQWGQEKLRLPTLSHCSFDSTPSVTQPALTHSAQTPHTKLLFPDFTFSSKKLYGLLVTEVCCLLGTTGKQEADVTHELTKTVWPHDST